MTFPLLYFPTRISILDDDYHFADTCKRLLEREDFSVTVHRRPETLIEDMNAESLEKTLKINVCITEETTFGIHESVLNLRGLVDVLQNPPTLRSLVFLDYEMPFGTGLDIRKHFHNAFVKAVLLTGAADEKIAVEAFNKGLIDGYLKKQDTNLATSVLEAAHRFVWTYFIELSRYIGQGIEDVKGILECPKIARWLYDFVTLRDVNAFCLLSTDGLFLIQKKDGSYHILKLVLKDHLTELLFSDSYDISKDLREDLLEGRKTFLFFEKDTYKLPKSNFEAYAYPVREDNGVSYAMVCLDLIEGLHFFDRNDLKHL